MGTLERVMPGSELPASPEAGVFGFGPRAE